MQTVDLPSVLVASSVPGRVRLTLPDFDFYGQEHTLKEVAQSLKGMTDFRLAKIAHSLVIYYDHRQTSSEAIVDQVKSTVLRLTAPTAGLLTPPSLSQQLIRLWERILGAIPKRTLVGVILIAIGIPLFIIPGIPGLPILFLGLGLLTQGENRRRT